MKIFAISEHFHPRVGGTVEYVDKICSALQGQGHQVHLLVPGNGAVAESLAGYSYRVTALGVGWPRVGDPDRETRYHFCDEVSKHLFLACDHGEVELVHVMFGLFVNEKLNTAKLRERGVPCVTTIHNVPPHECARSWPGDRLLERWRDQLRIKGVAAKNRARLTAHDYDAWVVPSDISRKLLRQVRGDVRIEVIGHGCSEALLKKVQVPETRAPKKGGLLRVLTVGGWVPHKRQHLIPEVADCLRNQGIQLVWDLVGPPGRVPRYQASIVEEIDRRGLKEIVRVRGAVSLDELSGYYEEANLYVQPSVEEGFCMTALDAAALGLPVIGSPAGVLPELCRMSEGALVPSVVEDLCCAIEHFVAADLWLSDSRSLAVKVGREFAWTKAAGKLATLYSGLALHTHPLN
ncbi:MAG: glycosyltransferase family 4 protein [Verrucomicrobiales bacterium]|nr:glycosyltransferase family 4 protein [Verrucomicrobiales bacterium]